MLLIDLVAHFPQPVLLMDRIGDRLLVVNSTIFIGADGYHPPSYNKDCYAKYQLLIFFNQGVILDSAGCNRALPPAGAPRHNRTARPVGLTLKMLVFLDYISYIFSIGTMGGIHKRDKCMKDIKRVGLLTGGGDCPGLNAVIRAVVKTLSLKHAIQVIGFEDGFEGLIENRSRPLSYDDASGILQLGGTILGTSNKANPFNQAIKQDGRIVKKDVSAQTLENISRHQLDALVCIGGDGTMTISRQLIEKGVAVVGVPKTIDNDLYGTDVTFGFDTAMTTAAMAIDYIHTTAQSHHRIMLVEIMGRYAGWLTLSAGIAGGADIILIPEIEYDIEAICAKVRERRDHGRNFSIIAISEGAKPKGGQMSVSRVVADSPDAIRLGGIAFKLGDEIEKCTGLETRATVLGHLQRGGSPSANDRLLATRFGVAAADAVAAGKMNQMVAVRGDSIGLVPIKEIGGRTRTVPADHPLLDVAKAVGTSLGV